MNPRRPVSATTRPVSTRPNNAYSVAAAPVALTLIILLGLAASVRSTAQTWDPDAPASFAVVVHVQNPIDELDQETLTRIYLRKQTTWNDRLPIQPVDLIRSHPARIEMAERLLGKSVSSLLAYWQRQVFSRGQEPPLEMGCCEDVVRWLEGQPAGIAYVPVDTRLPDQVKAIRIVDERGGVLVDLPNFSSSSGMVRRGDGGDEHALFETNPRRPDRRLESQDDVVLSEVGDCGVEDPDTEERGAWVVVANEDLHEARTVSIERIHQSPSRSRTYLDPIDLPPSSEWALGCTRPNRYEVLSFRIRGVSVADPADSETADLEPHRPRDVVRVVESGDCGPHSEGRDLHLINEHPYREAWVVAEHRQTMTGSGSRVFRRDYVLDAGQTVELGCNAGLDIALLTVQLN